LPIKQTKNILNDSIYSSIIAILTVGVFISMFFMLTDMFISPFQNINGNITAFISGLFEVTKGCQLFASYFIPQHISVTICSTLISFGGLCIILQSYTYLKDCGVSIWNILCTKATQASISTILTFLFASFLL